MGIPFKCQKPSWIFKLDLHEHCLYNKNQTDNNSPTNHQTAGIPMGNKCVPSFHCWQVFAILPQVDGLISELTFIISPLLILSCVYGLYRLTCR